MSVIIDGTSGITTPGLTNTGSETVVNLTTSGNTILGDASTDTLNVGNGGLIKDASGNIGVGVTPSATAGSWKAIELVNNGNCLVGGYGEIDLANNLKYDRAGGFSYVTTGYASRFVQSGGVFSWNSGTGTAGASAALAQAMTLDASGNLLVGTTDSSGTSGAGLKLIPSTTAPIYRNVMNTNLGGDSAIVVYNTNATNNGTRFYVNANGGIGNYSANNTNLSDERTKTDIQDAGRYLAKICAIPVRTFKYKDQTEDLLNLGCIAQEVEAVAPELVDVSGFGETPEDGVPLKAIYQTDLQYALMKCIQELNAKVEAQAAEIAILKGAA